MRRYGDSLSCMAELKTIHRATSLPLNSSKTNKSPTRSGLRLSLPLDMSCLRASRLQDNPNNLTHAAHPLCTSMTEYLSTRVRLPYAPFNRACISDHTVPRRMGTRSGQSIRSSTFDRLRRSQLCGGYNGEANIPPCSNQIRDITSSSKLQLYPDGFRIR